MAHPMEEAMTASTTGFEEAMRAAEADVGLGSGYALAEDGAVIPEGDVAQEEAPAEVAPVEETAPVAEEVAAPVEETRLIAGKYRSVEDALVALEESQRTIGSMANELGQLRQLVERPAQPAPATYDPAALSEALDGNPASIALVVAQAYQTGDAQTYNIAMDKWFEYSPRQAAAFETEVRLAQERQLTEAALEKSSAPSRNMELEQQNTRALNTVASRHEDFAQIVGALDETKLSKIVADGFPVQVLESIAAGDEQNAERVYETLYRWVKAEQAGHVSTAAAEAVAQQREESRREKQDAFVGSASTTHLDAPPPTEEERMIEAWGASPSLSSGWQGRDSRTRR